MWSADVHRMSVGGALTATSIWLIDVLDMLKNKEDLPHLASVVVVRGEMEKSSITKEFSIAKAVYSFLNDSVSTLFCFPGWNKGRVICHRAQLKRILSGFAQSSTDESTTTENFITLNDSTFPDPGSPANNFSDGQNVEPDIDRGIRKSKVMTTTV